MICNPRDVPVRFSALKKIAQSPAHYLSALLAESTPQSEAMRRGSLAHAVLFGQPQVAVFDGERRAGPAWKEFCAANEGKIIAKQAEYAEAVFMAEAVRRHPAAKRYLDRCTTFEQRVDWTLDGRACRSTPDAYGPGLLVDVKTTRCAEPQRFQRDALWRGYHAQLDFYSHAVGGEELAIIAVESEPPYLVSVHCVTDSLRAEARGLWRGWWERLKVCEESNKWPGYSDDAVPFEAANLGIEFEEEDSEQP